MKFPLSVKSPPWMNPVLGDIPHTREFRWAKRAVTIQAVAGQVVIALYWRVLPPQIPLWYSKPWGTDRLASPLLLLSPILSAAIVYAVNLYLISRFSREHMIFSRVLLLSSVVISVLSVMIVTRIVLLVT